MTYAVRAGGRRHGACSPKMVRLHARLEREGTGARMLIQVHDELVLETPKAHAEAALRAVAEEMQGALPLRVPLKVDAALG